MSELSTKVEEFLSRFVSSIDQHVAREKLHDLACKAAREGREAGFRDASLALGMELRGLTNDD